MDLYLLPEQQLLFAAQDIQEMENRNRITAEFGLQLSPLEMQELCVEHAEALKNSGRVELGGGILQQLAAAFANSPYLAPRKYAATLAALQELLFEEITDSEYLRHILLENELLGKFDVSPVLSLLKAACRDYRELLINLYEPVAANAIGLTPCSSILSPQKMAYPGGYAIFATIKEERETYLSPQPQSQPQPQWSSSSSTTTSNSSSSPQLGHSILPSSRIAPVI